MLHNILKTYKRAFTGLSKETWLLATVLFINRCGYMAVPFMGLYVTQNLGRPITDAGLIISLFGAGALIGSAIGGKLTDVIGFRPVQIYTSIIGGLLFLAFSTISNFTILCILSVVISFFYEAFRPANFVATAAYANAGNETRSYSLNRLATNIGWAVGVSLGGLIASYNYKLLFIVDGVISIAAGILILILLPQTKLIIKKRTKSEKKNIAKPWQDTLFVKFILISALFQTCFFLVFRVVPIFFKEDWKMGEFEIGLILGLNGVIIALFEMVMINHLEHKRPPILYIISGTILVGAAFLLLLIPLPLPILIAIIFMVVFTLGEMLSIPFINTFVIVRSNEDNKGLYAGAYTFSWSFASVAGPAAGFFFAEKFGYNLLWIALAGILLACAIGFKLLGKHMPSVQEFKI